MTTRDVVSEIHQPDGLIPVTPESVSQLVLEVKRLTSALEAKDAEIARLQAALSFWMPGVDLRLDDATRELVASDAELLAGYDGPVDSACWGDAILERANAAESRITSLERQLAEETERCARVAEANMHSSVMPGHVGKNIAAAIRGGAK